MRGEVHILVYCPIDTLQWGSTHSAVDGNEFLAVCKEIFPDATLSVGWTTGPEVSILNPN